MRKAIVSCFVILAAGLTFALLPSTPKTEIPTAAAKSKMTDAERDRAIRVTGKAIVDSCGEPARRWKEVSGKGKYVAIIEHLWYPKVPAEVVLSEYPNDPTMGDGEMFYGAAPSLKNDDMYDAAVLSKRMPCVSRWADIYAEMDKEVESGEYKFPSPKK